MGCFFFEYIPISRKNVKDKPTLTQNSIKNGNYFSNSHFIKLNFFAQNVYINIYYVI